jgi:hypothetical protein
MKSFGELYVRNVEIKCEKEAKGRMTVDIVYEFLGLKYILT